MNPKYKILDNKLKGILIKVIQHQSAVIIAKQCGYDFIMYDCEHGIFDDSKLHDLMVFGNSIGIPSIVRVPQLSRKDVSRTLDSGATGIMVPMIETPEQVIKLVEWAKYPPIGKRSYSGGANTFYGPSGNHRENMDNMNNKTIVIAQIESGLGIENIESIAKVEGLDGVIIGPVDLSISLNLTDDVMNEKEITSIRKVCEVCKKNNLGFGIIGKLDMIQLFKDDINFMILAIDTNIIRDGFDKYIQSYKNI